MRNGLALGRSRGQSEASPPLVQFVIPHDHLDVTDLASATASFLAALRETPDLWLSLDIRTIAVRAHDRWHNLITRCHLAATEVDEQMRLHSLPSEAELRCFQSVIPATELPTFLMSVSQGSAVVGEETVQFTAFDNAGGYTQTPYQTAWARFAAPQYGGASGAYGGSTAHQLEVSDWSIREYFKLRPEFFASLARRFEGLELPWEGVQGLARVALHSPYEVGPSNDARVDVVAPLGARFVDGTLRLESGKVTVTVATDSMAVGTRCQVGFIAKGPDGSYVNGTARIAAWRWRGRTSPKEAFLEFRVPRATQSVTLLLRVGTHVIERKDVQDAGAVDETVHLRAYEAFDPGLKSLRAALQPSVPAKERVAKRCHGNLKAPWRDYCPLGACTWRR